MNLVNFSIKKLAYCFYVVLSIVFIFGMLILYNNHKDTDFVLPEFVSLNKIYEKEELIEDDYKLIFEQTGLSKVAVDNLNNIEELSFYQAQYFQNYQVYKSGLNSLTVEDVLLLDGELYRFEFADLQVGDIIITLSNRTLGYNHGHSALILENDEVLMVDQPFTSSYISDISRINKFDTLIHLRLKEPSEYFLENVDDFVRENMLDIPYTFINLKSEKEYDGAYCSLLTYYVFKYFGYDLDGDGGLAVTPTDILIDDDLEIVQVYGINIEDYNLKV